MFSCSHRNGFSSEFNYVHTLQPYTLLNPLHLYRKSHTTCIVPLVWKKALTSSKLACLRQQEAVFVKMKATLSIALCVCMWEHLLWYRFALKKELSAHSFNTWALIIMPNRLAFSVRSSLNPTISQNYML